MIWVLLLTTLEVPVTAMEVFAGSSFDCEMSRNMSYNITAIDMFSDSNRYLFQFPPPPTPNNRLLILNMVHLQYIPNMRFSQASIHEKTTPHILYTHKHTRTHTCTPTTIIIAKVTISSKPNISSLGS